MHIITITNHKGGVGKTTSTASIAAAMHSEGLRVLMIDMDPQANLSQCFGVRAPEESIYRSLRGEQPLRSIVVREGLEIAPSDLELAGAELELAGEAGREYILRELLEPVRGSFDAVLIDTPPSLGLLTINALAASDYVFIPMQAEFLAMQGLTKLHDILDKVRKRLNRELKLGGIFLTRLNPRKVLSRDIIEGIGRHYGEHLLKTSIPDNVALAEAPARGMDVLQYAPGTKGAQEYVKLAREIMQVAGIQAKRKGRR
jgi:chromosome partitioning protein